MDQFKSVVQGSNGKKKFGAPELLYQTNGAHQVRFKALLQENPFLQVHVLHDTSVRKRWEFFTSMIVHLEQHAYIGTTALLVDTE